MNKKIVIYCSLCNKLCFTKFCPFSAKEKCHNADNMLYKRAKEEKKATENFKK